METEQEYKLETAILTMANEISRIKRLRDNQNLICDRIDDLENKLPEISKPVVGLV